MKLQVFFGLFLLFSIAGVAAANSNAMNGISNCTNNSDCEKILAACSCLAGDEDCKCPTGKCIEGKCEIQKNEKNCPAGASSENGTCHKLLSNGRKAEIKIMPSTASATAIARLGDLGFNITLKEVGSGNQTRAVYELTGKKEGKFLGIFKIMASERVEVDAETGEVRKVIKPWWSFLASGI